MILTLERILHNDWDELFPGKKCPSRLRIAALSSSREEAGTRCLLVFADHHEHPSLVAKLPRLARGGDGLKREHQRLSVLWPMLPPELAETIPKPLKQLELHGLPVFLQTAMFGKSLKTLQQRGEWRMSGVQTLRTLETFEKWLSRLQQVEVPLGVEVPHQAPLEVQLAEVLPVLVAHQRLTKVQGEALTEQALQLESALTTQQTWVHGDLWPGNILIEHERWHVIDWDGLSVGNPWLDRAWFALHLGMLAHASLLGREDLGEGLRRTLFMDHPVSEGVRGYLRQTLTLEGQPSGLARNLVAILLAIEAGRSMRQSSRGRAFDRAAPAILSEWFGYPEAVRL